MAKRQLGTSAFTPRDDERASLHPSNPEHFDALHHGGDPPEPTEEIILGPGAFGSPDPRTLGHVQLAGATMPHAASARKLDKDFESIREEAHAASAADTSAPESDEEDDDEAAEEDSESSEAENYATQSKADLLTLAKDRNLDVNENMSKGEIIDALVEDDNG